jgi:hypothetical protein
MEGSVDIMLEALRGAIDNLSDDPRILCAGGCGTRMEFRVDQFTREEPEVWHISTFIRREDGWLKIFQGDREVGVLCPSCVKSSVGNFKLSIAVPDAKVTEVK